VALDVASSAEGTLTIAFTGETMLGDQALPLLNEHGYTWAFDGVRSLLDADVVIVNHEAPITLQREPFRPDNLYSYSADPVSAPALQGVGVDVLGMANNHAMDRGPAGVADTMRVAEEAGLLALGAGRDEREAERPLIVRGNGVDVGVVFIAKGYGHSVTASRNRAGTIALSRASIRRGYELAKRADADCVVAFVHWGENYNSQVSEAQRQWAQVFAEEGYDLVIGHGPHVSQPAEIVGSTPVFYSIGNFVFGTNGSFRDETAPGIGLILDAGFSPEGLCSLEVTCVNTDNKQVGYQPKPFESERQAAIRQSFGIDAVLARVNADN
jgi:poly-gamma-glutamate synthesis protein (capsule biosynthesis protein)